MQCNLQMQEFMCFSISLLQNPLHSKKRNFNCNEAFFMHEVEKNPPSGVEKAREPDSQRQEYLIASKVSQSGQNTCRVAAGP